MGNRSGAALGAFFIALVVVLAGASLAKGGFFIAKHEGDTLHLLQMVMRMAQGDWPHLDFQTPIGVLAMAPIALFVRLGLGAGHAILLGQVLVAVVALPAVWWVATSRFSSRWGAVFGALVLILILALVHGEAERSVSISMHYNRWAWAAAFLAIATVMLPARSAAKPWADGLVVGAALSALVLIKVTYFIAFFPPIAIALIARKAWRSAGVGVAVGAFVIVLVTLLAGTPLFWLAYLRDLAIVAASDVRPQPGLPFAAVVGAPAYMGGSLMLLAAVILLRQARLATEGMVLLFLVPGFFYVTYQNFGNDPQWLWLLALMLVTLQPASEIRNGWGWNVSKGLGTVAIAAFAFAAPSAINLAYSPFRHLTAKAEDYTPLLPGSGLHEDLKTATTRAQRLDAKVALDAPGSAFAAFADPETRDTITEFRGETLPDCTVELGLVTWFSAISDDLKASGLADGSTVFAADILSSYWLFGAFDPLAGASPWYYGGLPGIENADYLLVPQCPLSPKVRKMILDAVDTADLTLTPARSTGMYALYAID